MELAEYDGRQLIFGFHPATSVPPEKILRLVAEPGERYRFSPDYRLSVRLGGLTGEALLAAAKKELQALL